MNSLSWLIYIADIIPRVGTFAFLTGMVLLSAGAVCTVSGRFVEWSEYSWTTKEQREANLASRSLLGRVGPRLLLAAPVFFLLAAIVPSTKTLYLIAASEAGEAVVTGPDAIEMMGDLKAIIKKRLKEELGE